MAKTEKTFDGYKTFAFKKERLELFEKTCADRGTAPVVLVRKLVDDYCDGLYVDLSRLEPGIVDELRRRGEEIKLRGDLDTVARMVLTEWYENRKPPKKR